MSTIGTGPAAGVAQTALQAQQVARQRDSRQAQSTEAGARLRRHVDEHLSVLDEADEETPDQLSIGDHLPNHQQERDESREKHEATVDETEAVENIAAPVPPPVGDDGLYHHVDVTA